MSLIKTLKPKFDSGDRSRGSDYQQQELISFLEFDDDVLTAEVDSSDGYSFYEVIIQLDNPLRAGGVYCSCPRFEDGFYCKHLWAVILEFESEFPGESQAIAAQIEPVAAIDHSSSKRPNQTESANWQTLLHRHRPDPFSLDQLMPTFSVDSRQHIETFYVFDVSAASAYGPPEIKLVIKRRQVYPDGTCGPLITHQLSRDSIDTAGDIDRQIAHQLLGVSRADRYLHSFNHRESYSRFEVEPHWTRELCVLLVQSGRAYWTLDPDLPIDDFHPLQSIDFKNPASIKLEVVEQSKPQGSARLVVNLQQQDQAIDQQQVVQMTRSGLLMLQDRLLTVANPEAIDLWRSANQQTMIVIPKSDRNAFLSSLADTTMATAVQLPDSWQLTRITDIAPVPTLRLRNWEDDPRILVGNLSFQYDKFEFEMLSQQAASFDEDRNAWVDRNWNREKDHIAELVGCPFVNPNCNRFHDHDVSLSARDLVPLVDYFAEQGWVVQLHDKKIRRPSQTVAAVASGQDWFDLHVHINYDGESIALPDLLKAIARKDQFITLSDGSQGRVSPKLTERFARLASFGTVEDDAIRFRPSQAMLLDAMLDSRETDFDRGFNTFRKKLAGFKGVKPKTAPRGFQGKLRAYQTEGLGWIHFLRDFQFGGCLADDMGLGKTIQVLSLLEQRRIRRVASKNTAQRSSQANEFDSDATHPLRETPQLKRKPSIVVAPKSLIFNWIDEAAKFTPKLRVLNYTGTDRKSNVEAAMSDGGFDVLITTYGTLTRDIAALSQMRFDYAILDESQAIKNANAQCSKACRLLVADHRLAMTGTPIENHLGELWSLFEFLNPGMLGNSRNFGRLTKQKKSNEQERDEMLARLSQALQPFLLRRTKEQVLTDLPPKTEQTLYCDMSPAQRKKYRELKEYYRIKLAEKVETEGLGRAKIHVLEALLRLRQAACDPRLLDQKAKPGAKLELLQQQMTELIAEGHKVLVFSQFTSLLGLVKQQFDRDGICYEYLDGQSRKRKQSVKRFQEDESVQAFLISIKAGGHGLNLTAADYVFLLDPWWNPAVEAQAIDRAHRMGQKNSVIAYRIVCRDTVEDKIIQLQNSKRELADKIIRADESLIQSLSANDLAFFFD